MARKTSTTAFVVADSHAVEAAMRERGVLPSARGPVIRLAPHFYNSLDDVDTALDVLTAALAIGVSALRQAARDLRLAPRHADDDHRRRHRPRERVALPVHGRKVRRRRVRALLHPRLRRHRRARR